jgi:hypothetical protein
MMVQVYSKYLDCHCDSQLWENILKIDHKFKKIIYLLTKELDQLSRQSFKDEFIMIDPLINQDEIDNSSLYSL